MSQPVRKPPLPIPVEDAPVKHGVVGTIEENSKRKSLRVDFPLTVYLGNRKYYTADWSLTGIGLKELDFEVHKNDKAHARIALPFQGFELTADVTIGCMWSASGRAGFKFLNLPDSQKLVMKKIMESYLNGEIVDMQGVLASPNNSSSNDAPSEKQNRLAWVKVSAIYFVAFVCVVMFFLGVHEKFFTLTSNRAHVTTVGVELTAPNQGVLKFEKISRGQLVKEGTVLARVVNTNLLNDLDVALKTYQAAQSTVSSLKTKLNRQKQTSNNIRQFKRSENEVEINRAKQSMEIAKENLDRLQNLLKSGLVSRIDLNEAREKYNDTRSFYQAKVREREALSAYGQNESSSMFFKDIRDQKSEYNATLQDLTIASGQESVAEARLRALQVRSTKLSVLSPCNCIVDKIYKPSGTSVQEGSEIFRLKSSLRDDFKVESLLNRDQASVLAIGDQALIRISSSSSIVKGTIESIQDASEAVYSLGSPRLGISESSGLTRVIIKPEADVRKLQLGTPVIVKFKYDRWPFISRILRKFK